MPIAANIERVRLLDLMAYQTSPCAQTDPSTNHRYRIDDIRSSSTRCIAAALASSPTKSRGLAQSAARLPHGKQKARS